MFDEQVITSVMTRVRALEKLHDPEYAGKLRMGDLYELLIEAGYSKEAAQKAANKRGNDRLSARLEA